MKKVIAILLSIIMIMGVAPMFVLAEDAASEDTSISTEESTVAEETTTDLEDVIKDTAAGIIGDLTGGGEDNRFVEVFLIDWNALVRIFNYFIEFITSLFK